MQIMICGSMQFAKKMLQVKKSLEELGFTVRVPCDIQKFIDEPNFSTDNHEKDYKHCLENDVIKTDMKSVVESDAILVLNYPKHNIEGYIGASTLMEIGLAYYHNKKILLLFPPPKLEEAKHSHELSIMQPYVLGGDINNIKKFCSSLGG